MESAKNKTLKDYPNSERICQYTRNTSFQHCMGEGKPCLNYTRFLILQRNKTLPCMVAEEQVEWSEDYLWESVLSYLVCLGH